jgi:hypothetical protein
MSNESCQKCLHHWTWQKECGCRVHEGTAHEKRCLEQKDFVICKGFQPKNS